jgi:hypothetical protein
MGRIRRIGMLPSDPYCTCNCLKSQHFDAAAGGRGHCNGCCEPEDTDSSSGCNHRFKPKLRLVIKFIKKEVVE